MRQILALVFIFVCTTIAWIVLGATIFSRTYGANQQLQGHVASTWGTSQEQSPPTAHYSVTEQTSSTTVERGRLVVHNEKVEHQIPLPLESSRIRVKINLDPRQKGLLWYSTYAVDFGGDYVFRNPTEEARLADAGYNLREAYAIYTGLCEWAQCGRPTQSTPVVSSSESKLKLETTLSEGLPDWWGKDRSRILASSVCVKLNGKEIPHASDRATKKLTAELPLEKGDKALLEIHFANYLGNHNWPQRFSVELNESGEHPTVKPLGTAPATATTRSLRQ